MTYRANVALFTAQGAPGVLWGSPDVDALPVRVCGPLWVIWYDLGMDVGASVVVALSVHSSHVMCHMTHNVEHGIQTWWRGLMSNMPRMQADPPQGRRKPHVHLEVVTAAPWRAGVRGPPPRVSIPFYFPSIHGLFSPRVQHRYGKTCGVPKTGSVVTGMVSNLVYPGYTAYLWHGIMGINGYFKLETNVFAETSSLLPFFMHLFLLLMAWHHGYQGLFQA